jgi:hypothetical protein
MDEFATHFCRNADGSWTCISDGTFNGPNGRIQVSAGSRFYPGTTFMGFDLAAWLDRKIEPEMQDCASAERTEERRKAERRHRAG